jgi:lipid-A-disaccharide synthase-like uncharacterized protein
MIDFLKHNWIYTIGFGAQLIFGIRMAVQWLQSEKKGRTESPVIFWQLSLLGSFLLLLYGGLRNDLVIIIGQTLSYFIFIRNLSLNNSWNSILLPFRILIVSVPLLVILWIAGNDDEIIGFSLSTITYDLFFYLGLTGQLLMSFRFIQQWYFSEKEKKSILPLSFWYTTLIASLMIIVYAVVRYDPVLILAQIFSLLSAIRNIQLFKKD